MHGGQVKREIEGPGSCVSVHSSFYHVFFFYNRYFRTNQIRSMMSLKKFGSDSGSSGIYYFLAFPLRSEYYVSGVFASDVFTPTGFESKGVQLLPIFLRSN